MSYVEKGRLLRDALEGFGSLVSPQGNLFPVDNLFGRAPTFLFRYVPEVDASIYDLVHRTVESFSGKLQWTMYKAANSKNYVIEPTYFHNERLRANGRCIIDGPAQDVILQSVDDVQGLSEALIRASMKR